MKGNDPDWIAPKTGHDWKDADLMRAVSWLKSFVPESEMNNRLDQAKNNIVASREAMIKGKLSEYYNINDISAWYILQAETFATDRFYYTQEGTMRVVPFFVRIGKELDTLLTIKGAEERAARLMLSERRQPDGGIFELLVALAYRRRGWERVEFIPETPGLGKTHDLNVFRPSKRWAVECKRLMPSPYAAREKNVERSSQSQSTR